MAETILVLTYRWHSARIMQFSDLLPASQIKLIELCARTLANHPDQTSAELNCLCDVPLSSSSDLALYRATRFPVLTQHSEE